MTELIVTEGGTLQIPLTNRSRVILSPGDVIDSDTIDPEWDSEGRLEPVSSFRDRVTEARDALDAGDEAVIDYLRADPETRTWLDRLLRRGA